MEDKKRVTILAIIALVLAVTAIAINVADSSEVSTQIQNPATGAVIGINIQPSPLIEDKLTEETSQQ